jgi:hypothetical protein
MSTDVQSGEVVVLTATYRNDNGALADPAQPVDLVVKDPSGNRQTISPTKTGTGQWEHEYRVTERGLYEYSYRTQDVGIREGRVIVRERIGAIPPLQTGLTATVTDALTVSDSVGAAATLSPSVADVVALDDTPSAIVTRALDVSDTLTVSDAISHTKVLGASLSDTVVISDSISTLAAPIQAEKDRAESAGATIEPGAYTDLIQPAYEVLNGAGLWSNVEGFYVAGVRDVVSGSQSKIYDQSGNQRDATQSTTSQRFTDTTSADYNSHVVSSGDGSDDILISGSYSLVGQPITDIVVGAIDNSGDAALFSGDNNLNVEEGAALLLYDNSGSWGIFSGTILSGGTRDTTPHVFEAVYNGASSTLDVDGTDVASGDSGQRGTKINVLMNQEKSVRSNGEEGAFWLRVSSDLSQSVKDDLRTNVLNPYYGL